MTFPRPVMPSVGLVVPMFNEEALVEQVVAQYVVALSRVSGLTRLVVVDNGSTDTTGACLMRAVASYPSVEVVKLPANAGYGGGIHAGLAHLAQGNPPDIVGWAWGDGQVDPAVIPSLVAALVHGADLAKVRRVSRRDGWRRQLITREYARWAARFGVASADINGCPKLLWRARLAEAKLRATDWFLDPELVLRAEQWGWVVAELPAAMEPRSAGRSKVNWGTVAGFAAKLGLWQFGWRP